MRTKTGQSIVEVALVLSVTAAAFSAMMVFLRRDFNARYRQGISYVFNELKKEAENRAEAIDQDNPELAEQLKRLAEQCKQHQYETHFQEKETVEEIIKNVRTGGSAGTSVSMEIKNSGWTTIGPDGG